MQKAIHLLKERNRIYYMYIFIVCFGLLQKRNRLVRIIIALDIKSMYKIDKQKLHLILIGYIFNINRSNVLCSVGVCFVKSCNKHMYWKQLRWGPSVRSDLDFAMIRWILDLVQTLTSINIHKSCWQTKRSKVKLVETIFVRETPFWLCGLDNVAFLPTYFNYYMLSHLEFPAWLA